MEITMGSGNVSVMCFQDPDTKVDYGIAFCIRPESHEIGSEDMSVVGKRLKEVGADLTLEFTRWESAQVVIDKLTIVRDSLMAADAMKGVSQMDCKTALQTILDQVDYTSGACRPNEMVGAVLPKEVIVLCRQAVEQQRVADGGESAALFVARNSEKFKDAVGTIKPRRR